MGGTGGDLRGRLVEIEPSGRLGPNHGQVVGASGVGRSCAAPSFLAASAVTPIAASAALAGVFLSLTEGWPDLERLFVRLAVAEAEAGLPEHRIRVAAMATAPRALLALCRPPPPLPRLFALGLDGPSCAREGPARVTARGIILIAASAAGVPAFERLTAASDEAFAASRAAGFSLALLD